MLTRVDIDDLYETFCAGLPEGVRPLAVELPSALGLAPRGTRWSNVFGHAVTLRAPMLVAEAMPLVSASLVGYAVAAHAFAVIEAFATDRIEDGQIEATEQLRTIVERLRDARDDALRRLTPGVSDEEIDGRRADAVTLAAIRAERQVLTTSNGVDFATYLSVSAAKQRVGLPASVALAHAAGWDARRRMAVRRLLEDVWVGLQLADDVADWEEDWARGGSWAVAIAWHEQASRPSRDRETLPPITSRFVDAASILPRMLRTARRRFRAAARRAASLHMRELAAWAREREAHVQSLATNEDAAPGYTQRSRALEAWAREVLT